MRHALSAVYVLLFDPRPVFAFFFFADEDGDDASAETRFLFPVAAKFFS